MKAQGKAAHTPEAAEKHDYAILYRHLFVRSKMDVGQLWAKLHMASGTQPAKRSLEAVVAQRVGCK